MPKPNQRAAPDEPAVTRLHQSGAGRMLDEMLVARLARGDASAIGALFDAWCDPVYALVSRLVGATHDAEAIVEEVFVHASRRAETYRRERGTPCAWLLAIARAQSNAVVSGNGGGLDRAAPGHRHDHELAGDYALDDPDHPAA